MENKIKAVNAVLKLIQAPMFGPDEMMMDELGYDAGFNGPNTHNMRPLVLSGCTDALKKIWGVARERGSADRRKKRMAEDRERWAREEAEELSATGEKD